MAKTRILAKAIYYGMYYEEPLVLCMVPGNVNMFTVYYWYMCTGIIYRHNLSDDQTRQWYFNIAM